jgi:hypothetical protein
LYNEYLVYCEGERIRKCGRNDFYKKLESINIHRKKINGYWYFSIDLPTLKEIAKKYKWVCCYDEYEDEVEDEEETQEDEIDYQASYEQLKLAYEEL